jgi:hypothetical protein
MSEAMPEAEEPDHVEKTLEKEVRIAELLARRAEAKLRQTDAEWKRAELLRAKRADKSSPDA